MLGPPENLAICCEHAFCDSKPKKRNRCRFDSYPLEFPDWGVRQRVPSDSCAWVGVVLHYIWNKKYVSKLANGWAGRRLAFFGLDVFGAMLGKLRHELWGLDASRRHARTTGALANRVRGNSVHECEGPDAARW